MPAFEFTALDVNGREHKGVLEGDGPRAVRQQLRERQWTPLTVQEVAAREAKSGARRFSLQRGVAAADLALMTRQLATLVRSGLPLEESVRAVSQQTEKARLKSMLLGVRSRVMEGHTLAAGLAEFPHVFPELYRATVAAGEQSGHLDVVLERLADYTESRQQLPPRGCRRLQPARRIAQVGVAINYRGFQAAKNWSPLDHLAAGLQSSTFNDLFPRTLQDGAMKISLWRRRIPEAKGTQDFIGINYYTVDRVAFSLRKYQELFGRRFYPDGADLSDTGFIANEPQGMFAALKWGRGFNMPMYVTENGEEDQDDHLRPRYLARHIHQVWRGVNFNWPVRGYFHWTLVDNFEWERGWTQRFGLWELNVETQARRKRPSADLYAEICAENGLSSEMVAKYAPEVLDILFP